MIEGASPADSRLSDRQRVGIMIVDHGSRRAASNDGLWQVVELFRKAHGGFRGVEAAHMELAEPSIGTAFRRLVEQGAEAVIAHPFFLLPGSHWDQDIPRLVGEAAAAFPEVPYLVTAPLGSHPLMAQIMLDRIEHCWQHAEHQTAACQICDHEQRCLWRFGGGESGSPGRTPLA